MNSEYLLEIMTDIDDPYIEAAEQCLGIMEIGSPQKTQNTTRKINAKNGAKNKRKKSPYRMRLFRFAAVLAVALIVVWFTRTPTGVVLAKTMHEQVVRFIETLFPPKDIPVAPEGEIEEIEHTAQGKEPESDAPGFAIYVDAERFYMTEENGNYYIRPIGADETSALICEMEIQEMTDIARDEAAQAVLDRIREEQEAGKWDSVSELETDTDMERLHFCASEGVDWDSAQEEHYFYQADGQKTYHITLRYFLEAAEGNGTRFHAMLDTFTSVSTQDASQSDIIQDTPQSDVTE